MRFQRSKLYVSVIPVAGLGLVIGMLSAIMGVGGGFIMVPALIYLLRVPTNVVIGTSLFQIIFTAAVTTVLQASTNRTIDVVLAFLLMLGGVIGAQFGAEAGRKLRGDQLRALLALLVLAVALRLGFELVSRRPSPIPSACRAERSDEPAGRSLFAAPGSRPDGGVRRCLGDPRALRPGRGAAEPRELRDRPLDRPHRHHLRLLRHPAGRLRCARQRRCADPAAAALRHRRRADRPAPPGGGPAQGAHARHLDQPRFGEIQHRAGLLRARLDAPARRHRPQKLRVSLSIGIDDLRLWAQRWRASLGACRRRGRRAAGEGAARTGRGAGRLGRPRRHRPSGGHADIGQPRRICHRAAPDPRQPGLYNQTIGRVEFVSPTLFRADLQLPADLPVGITRSAPSCFATASSSARAASRCSSSRPASKLVHDFPQHYAFLYGLFAVALAIFMGWFGRVVFKRD